MLKPARYDWVLYQGTDQYESFGALYGVGPATPFAISSPYQVGDAVTDDAGNLYLVIVAGTTAASVPPWNTGMGQRTVSNTATFMRVGSTRLLDTASYSVRWKVRQDPGGTVLATGSNGDGHAEIGYSPGKWATGTVYAVGQQVIPKLSGPNGFLYVVETAGTSHASTEPTWPTTIGTTVSDNGVIWRCLTTDAGVSNVRIALTPAYTNSLTGWGAEVFQLDLIEPTTGKIIPLIWGMCSFSAKIAEA
jgi:hypothetical protein